MRKSKRKIELADEPLMELSFMRSTKILGEDRASISKPKGHSKKANTFVRNIQLELSRLTSTSLLRASPVEIYCY